MLTLLALPAVFVNLCVSRENQGKNTRFKPEDLEPFESAPFYRPLLLEKERSPPGGGLPSFEFDFASISLGAGGQGFAGWCSLERASPCRLVGGFGIGPTDCSRRPHPHP